MTLVFRLAPALRGRMALTVCLLTLAGCASLAPLTGLRDAAP
ncbi:MAG: hypothetical protein JWQ03_2551, partial [Variovorax sp.]|nr:hypothetical protein [Variovorax sp.]